MKKLLCSAAVCGLALAATPAHAQIQLELGGFFKGYGAYIDQDDNTSDNAATAADEGADARDLDIIRQTEIHFGGETTLDNGLVVGFHVEAEADQGDSFDVEETYAYFSGGWGRVNFGAEDGAAYLLQVAAPSADSNVDGIREYVRPFNYAIAGSTALGGVELDYDQDDTGYSDKLTYLSPIMNGFQVGMSYTPEVTDAFDADGVADAAGAASRTFGVANDDVVGEFGEAYEIAARYEGMFNNIGVNLGAGFIHTELENSPSAAQLGALGAGATLATDDRQSWNVGADFDIGAFGLGVIYKEDDFGDFQGSGLVDASDEEETLVVGVDYTTGPFKLGMSYMDQDNTGYLTGNSGVGSGIETERWTGGVVYTYGPGMTFRGSISYIEHDNVSLTDAGGGAAVGAGEDSIEATSILIGTQIDF